MTNEAIIKLCNYLKTLAQRLEENGDGWCTWVQGNLEGISESLIIGINLDEDGKPEK